jgi:hypothetical protein
MVARSVVSRLVREAPTTGSGVRRAPRDPMTPGVSLEAAMLQSGFPFDSPRRESSAASQPAVGVSLEAAMLQSGRSPNGC